MENTLLRMTIGAAAVFAILALPSVAAAGTVVPPGNSAATQYTETFPTTGGNAEVNSSIGGGGDSQKGGGRSPKDVLGSDTARHLEEQGPAGETVATLATEAAPGSGSGSGGSDGSGKDGDASGGGGGSKGSGQDVAVGDAQAVAGGGPAVDAPAGSSGLSEVFSHATGSSSGEMGIFLPLVLLAAPVLALIYAWRRREPGRAAP
ncbi:MAG: hypothetical protein WBL45_05740 [Solirubrobacterales bacterium]